MANDPGGPTCIVVGAGISGLCAARALRDGGRAVTVLDKGRRVGGRMATRHDDDAVYDVGAQFLTATDPRFTALLEDWKRAGVAREWGLGFVSGDGRMTRDGQPRFRGAPYMRAIPEFLAEGLDVHTGERVVALGCEAGRWQVRTELGARFEAEALLLTPPVPQSLELLESSRIPIPPHRRDELGTIEYDPCIALLVELDGPSAIPEPGGLRLPAEEIVWMADNRAKGVSSGAWTVTIHGGPEFSSENYDAEDDLVTTLLLGAAHQWLGARVKSTRLHRWRYSQVVRCYADSCHFQAEPAALCIAGDGFGSPRMEGAAMSGLAAASRLLAQTAGA